jgi:hypothetical protein
MLQRLANCHLASFLPVDVVNMFDLGVYQPMR